MTDELMCKATTGKSKAQLHYITQTKEVASTHHDVALPISSCWLSSAASFLGILLANSNPQTAPMAPQLSRDNSHTKLCFKALKE
jgi:hypothetical protein